MASKVWQIGGHCEHMANIYPQCHLVGGGLEASVRVWVNLEDVVVQVLCQRAPDIPYENSLSLRQASQKMNAEVKRVLEEDTSGHDSYYSVCVLVVTTVSFA